MLIAAAAHAREFMMMHSLRACLLGWLLVPVAVFVSVTGLMSYDAARETACLLQDNALLASARIIAEVHVFERFYRGPTDAEGTGLSLSIVSEIAHSHGGTVALRPHAEHVGLVVTVHLPRWSD